MTEKQRREEAIESIRSKVCGDRLKDYGSVESNFGRIAALWNVWLSEKNVKLGPEDVAAMMILMKVARLMENPMHLDSAIDAGGYAVCWAVMAGKSESLKKELDGLAPAVDHGEEELKKQVGQPVGKQEPVTSKTLDGKAAVMEMVYPPPVFRCQEKDGHGNQCSRADGHTSDHDFTVKHFRY